MSTVLSVPIESSPGRHLHIIEPTLIDTTGHCYSLVHALAGAAAQRLPSTAITIWAGRGADTGWDGPGRLVPHFTRRLRRLQTWLLLRRLLRRPETDPLRVLIATAGTTDLWLADRAAGATLPAGRLCAFVHWLNAKTGKASLLSAIARRRSSMRILAPTASVAGFFAECGFDAQFVPYPLAPTAASATDRAPAPFRHLLVPGGARLDKGFDHVVALVAELSRRGATLPVVVQTSVEQRQRGNPELAALLAQLLALGYPHLQAIDQALDAAAYEALFDGAIVIQPYRADDFRDRVSGVTLDALAAAAPVVVTAGTWMDRLVSQWQAGAAVDDRSPASLLAAIERVRADYARLAGNARRAAAAVRSEHSAQRLVDAVLGQGTEDRPAAATA